MRQEKKLASDVAAAKKTFNAATNDQRLADLRAKADVHPSTMFLHDPKFSQWDNEGIPTHDDQGQELAKSRRKKLLKEYEAQQKLHAKFSSLAL